MSTHKFVTYNEEFKVEAVRLYLEGAKGYKALAEELGVKDCKTLHGLNNNLEQQFWRSISSVRIMNIAEWSLLFAVKDSLMPGCGAALGSRLSVHA